MNAFKENQSMIRGKLQDGFRTMFGFHVRRNSTDSPNTLNGSGKWVEIPPSNSGGSPRTEVGEIDTSAPFESVKAALSLFADAGTSPRGGALSPANNKPIVIKKSKTGDEQRVLEKETQIHLALRELEEFKERLKHSEASKLQAIRELEKANKTLQELTNKVEIVSESKHAAVESAESLKQRAQEIEDQKSTKLGDGGEGGVGKGGGADAWKQDVDSEREQYRATSAQLISAKQELTMLRQDFYVILEAKLAAFQQAADAKHVTQVKQERVARITKEIAGMRETLGQVKLATLEAHKLQNQHHAEREARLLSHSRAKEGLELTMKTLKEDNDPQPREILEQKLEETNEAIKVMEEQLKNVRESDMLSLKQATEELDDAKKALEEIVEEENRQRNSENVLKQELDEVRREQCELKDKMMEAEKRVENMKDQVEGYKRELKGGEGIKNQESLCDDMKLQLRQVEAESEKAREEAEKTRKKIVLVREEVERAREEARESEERLKIVLGEVEEAQAAARSAGEMIHERKGESEDSSGTSSTSGGKIKLSMEEFESLSKKAEESRADADVKVATIMVQIESIKASEKEALKKMEGFRTEKEGMESAIEEAVKQAEITETAKQAVDVELLKWRQKESFNSS